MNQEKITVQNDKIEFIKYLIPSMLSMLAVSCYSFVDTFVVGKAIGSLAVGAMGLCTPVLSALYALGFLFGTGGGIRYSIRLSQGQKKEASGVFTTSVLSAVIIGLLITVSGNLFIHGLATFLGATDGNIDLSVEYLRWVITLAPFMILDIILNSFMRNEGHPNVSMIATLTGTGLNVILDFVFVLGFRWGMNGAASATVLASVISVGINLFYALTHNTSMRFTKTNLSLKTLGIISELGACSFVLESATAVITVIFVNAAGGHFGDNGISAFSAIMTFNLVVYSLLNGVAQSMQPLVSTSYGNGDQKEMNRFLRFSLVPSVGIGAVATALAFLLSKPLAAVFLSDKIEALDLASLGLRCFALSFLFMSVSIIFGIYNQAKEDIVHSLLILLGRSFVLPVICLLILTPMIRDNAVWLAIPAGEGLAMIMSIVFRLSEIHKNNKTERVSG